MVALRIILLFLFNQIVLSLKNKLDNNNKKEVNLRSLNLIQNIPVENNIPIIQDFNKNNIIKSDPKNIQNNQNPLHIPIIIPRLNKPMHIITNTSIKINMTNKDPMCTPECIAGCEVQFQKVIMEKNCIINVCKCQIIEINSEKINMTNGNTKIKEEKISLSLMDNKIKMNSIEDNFPYTFYFFILLIFVIYEIYIIYRLNYKGFVLNNEEVPKKNKEDRIKDYMDLLYDDEELIECLI